MTSIKQYLSIITLLLLGFQLLAQNTVGTILNTADSDAGYTLFTPFTNTEPNYTYLINNCGEVVNSWTTSFKGQGSDRLMEDGTLYRGAYNDQSGLSYNGNNGRLEHLDWEGNVIWAINYTGSGFGFHHDFTVLPNGNVLLLVVERMSMAEALAAGRDPASLLQDELYTEKVIEITPEGTGGNSIVWEWDFFDHLVQDFDSTKDNFGVVADHPEKLNINYFAYGNFSELNNADWVHTNAIDYNEALDQIVISARGTSEFYIIDHSTTTAEAATGSGGTSDKGGDFLYRWGNSAAYNKGTEADQKLFAQHAVHWIPEGLPNAGKLLTFNNGFSRDFSSVELVEQPTPDSNGVYPYGNSYEPSESTTLYVDPVDPANFYSAFVSSAYYTPNGNIIVQSGTQNRLFEVNSSAQTVWEYINPISINNGISEQGGTPPGPNDRRTFRARRYAPDYAAFDGRDLTPGVPIELNPILANCELLDVEEHSLISEVSIGPNPARNQVLIYTAENQLSFTIYDLSGKIVLKGSGKRIDISNISNGLYIVKTTVGNSTITHRLIKN
ncbi:MAG: hypothetical protein ACI828_002080 [Flavobacteriales bacterium]|jgi:hypothetical protein